MNFIKNVRLILVSILFSLPLYAMEEDGLLQGKYLIKNVKHKEFLFVADSDRIGTDRAVEASPGIFSKSIFSFEKDNVEGYRIKNIKHGEYLFVADSDRIRGDRAVETSPEIMSKSYFYIKKEKNAYVIKSTKHSEYLFVSDSDRTNGSRAVESKGTIMEKSLFVFIPYTQGYFE